jgi:hypothetical protein
MYIFADYIRKLRINAVGAAEKQGEVTDWNVLLKRDDVNHIPQCVIDFSKIIDKMLYFTCRFLYG